LYRKSCFLNPAMALRLLPSLLVLASWLARPAPAWACWCFQHDVVSPRDAFARADAVFLGTVTGIADYRNLPGFDWLIRAWPDAARRLSDISVRFSVMGSWKSVSTSVVTVRTRYICGYQFSPGMQYVVYAHESQDWLRVNFCTRTLPAGSAAEDFACLDALPQLPLARAWPSPLALGCLGLGGAVALSTTTAAWHVRCRPQSK